MKIWVADSNPKYRWEKEARGDINNDELVKNDIGGIFLVTIHEAMDAGLFTLAMERMMG